jgi:titin
VWVRYGTDTDPTDAGVTASWDKLAVVAAPTLSLVHEGLNPGKTFQYRVQAFNAAGYGAMSNVVAAKTADGMLLGVINTKVTGITTSTVALTFFDQDFNEIGFVVDRQDVLPGGGLGAWTTIAYLGTPNMAGSVSVTFTDGVALPTCPADVVHNVPSLAGCYVTGYVPLVSGQTYNYRISSYNGFQVSPPDLAVAATLLAVPIAPSGLAATLAGGVTLTWTDNSINETSFRIERAIGAGAFATLATVAANTVSYVDSTVAEATTYTYRVIAVNAVGDSVPSGTATVTTPVALAAPSALTATPTAPSPNPPRVTLKWTDNQSVAPQETGFYVERDGVRIATVAANVVTYTDTTVAPKVTYTYRVQAYRTVGAVTAVSAYSNTSTVVTPGQVPQTPASLRFVSSTRTAITLSWVDKSTNETRFSLERSLDTTVRTWSVVAGNIAPNTVRYVDGAGLTRNTRYVYRIQACNADGCSGYSGIVQAKTAK